MPSSVLVDQAIELIIHHPYITAACAAAAALLSWLVTQGRDSAR